MEICFNGNSIDNLKLYSRAMVRDANATSHVFVGTEGDVWPAPIISIGLCWEPGKALWATKEQRALGFDDLFSAISSETRAFWGEVKKIGDSLKAEHGLSSAPPKLTGCLKIAMDTFYVNMMLTDRHFRGRGYGSAIMRAIIDHAAQEGRKWSVGLMTQSAENRDWYASLGFKEVASSRIPAAPYGDFIPIYAFEPYETNLK
ncbi:hypothetical protein D9757_013709 [Collybiopsis confluens]|uniref:N-acetyltransferase domain-containing protein n=1 Tax=Collybiopsis confluens TaxID=2823264 RepID=A0A8H5D5H2_9AGAR|nr:hypothetical protein D9757_013709 [Collybiopsis confluens]